MLLKVGRQQLCFHDGAGGVTGDDGEAGVGEAELKKRGDNLVGWPCNGYAFCTQELKPRVGFNAQDDFRGHLTLIDFVYCQYSVADAAHQHDDGIRLLQPIGTLEPGAGEREQDGGKKK